MAHAEPAETLEAILTAENEALKRHDADGAVALLDQKLAAAKALSAHTVTPEQAERLRALAEENRQLLERAIDVQGRIITMVARAAMASMPHPRYSAAGQNIRPDGAIALARQA